MYEVQASVAVLLMLIPSPARFLVLSMSKLNVQVSHIFYSLSDKVSKSHSVSVDAVVVASIADIVAIASEVKGHLIDLSKYPKTPFDIATV